MKPFGLLDDEELEQSPSVRDGMTQEQVLEYTRKSMVFIKNVGDLLKLQLISRSSARAFFHRFFSRQSFKQHDRFVVSATCILLACKVEEDVRKLDAVLDAYFSARKGSQQVHALPRDNPEVKAVREKILLCERILLHTVGFDITIEHPHTSALKILRSIKGMNTVLKQATWNMLNDSLNINMCLRFPPKLVAVAAVLCASQFILSKPDPIPEETRLVIQKVENLQGSFGFTPDEVNKAVNTLLDTYDATAWPKSKTTTRPASATRESTPPKPVSEEPSAKKQKLDSALEAQDSKSKSEAVSSPGSG